MPGQSNPWETATGAALRAAIRRGEMAGPTAGLARGYAQANVVLLPADFAEEFAEFCRVNPLACPLLEQTAAGDPQPRRLAPGSDLRTDVPRYRIFRHGQAEPQEPTDVRKLWQPDLTGFLLGCSFTFEQALAEAGLAPRHVQRGTNVSMYRTVIPCRPAGRFAGPLVVSMRPYRREDVPTVTAITSRFPTMHGGPIHVGDPAALGITDLARPEFGNAVDLLPGEVPMFWACGVTPQLALAAASPALAITHSPGCMFVTDRLDASFAVEPEPTN